MASAPHLIFSLHDSLYAVPALAVCEIIWLPELTPLVEAPFYMAGVFNLRGNVVPVIDLNLRLGHSRQPLQVSDSVILLEDDDHLVGIIVNEVRRVQSIAEEEIGELPPSLSLAGNGAAATRFVSGIARVDEEIVLMLQVENLLRLPENSTPPQENGTIPADETAELAFCPQATPEEKAILQTRAQTLRQPLATDESDGLMPVAVVGLNGEYFGIDLPLVREFSALRTVTPVPCCPEHIVGQMNLRGDILTLLDIRSALQMPLPGASGEKSVEAGKVVVIEVDGLRVGVLVDEVFDVMNLQPAAVRAVPSAVQSLREEYLKGMAPYAEKMLSILDLPKILTLGALVVNEEA